MITIARKLGIVNRDKRIDKYIKWVKNHQDKSTGEYKKPRSRIKQNGNILLNEELTAEQIREVRLGNWWRQTSKERKILNQYKDISEDEFIKLPEEIRELLLTCSKYGIKPECKILQQVKKCVKDNVGTNDETRSELAKMVIEYNQNDIMKNKKAEIIELIKSGFPKELIAFEYQLDIEYIEKCEREIEEEMDR